MVLPSGVIELEKETTYYSKDIEDFFKTFRNVIQPYTYFKCTKVSNSYTSRFYIESIIKGNSISYYIDDNKVIVRMTVNGQICLSECSEEPDYDIEKGVENAT